MPMAIITAIIMTDKCCTMPTAVITLSSENTASSTTICTITIQKVACTGFSSFSAGFPSIRSRSSIVPLNNRNTPPNSKIRSRPEKGCSKIWNSGWVRVTTHAIDASKIRRMPKARIRPTTRAVLRCSGGSFSAKMAINTKLSMPSTISSTIRVNNPTHAAGSDIHSKIICSSPEYLKRNTQKTYPVLKPTWLALAGLTSH